jgi:hypothetical protein
MDIIISEVIFLRDRKMKGTEDKKKTKRKYKNREEQTFDRENSPEQNGEDF